MMSRGTSTFLVCFTGFWLLWALGALLCCLCGALRRRFKGVRENHCFRTLETEPADRCPPLPAFCALLPLYSPGHSPQTLPEAHWVTTSPGTDADRDPPCYEEAVMMDDPPPSYTQVLADPLKGRGVSLKTPQQRGPPWSQWELPGWDPDQALLSGSSKPPGPGAGYCSLIHLPSAHRWEALGQLLSNMDFSHSTDLEHNMDHRNLLPETQTQSEFLGLSRVYGMEGLQEVQQVNGPEPGLGFPRVCPMLGRSTAV